jgi:hypothetical protein
MRRKGHLYLLSIFFFCILAIPKTNSPAVLIGSGGDRFKIFGVPKYVVMIQIGSAPQEISVDFECPWGAATQMKSFYDTIMNYVLLANDSSTT